MEYYYINGELLKVDRSKVSLTSFVERHLIRFSNAIFVSVEDDFMFIKNRWTGLSPIFSTTLDSLGYILEMERTYRTHGEIPLIRQVTVTTSLHAELILARMFPDSIRRGLR